MGCASSKQSKCRNCGKDPSLICRSNSVPINIPLPIQIPAAHHRNADNIYHVVSLNSSTLGSLKLDSPLLNNHNHHSYHNRTSPLHNIHHHDNNEGHHSNGYDYDCNIEKKQRNNSVEFSKEIRLAKTWSDMINQKIPKVIPKTPIRTPPGEPETINTWELMEGLEEINPLHLPNLTDPHRCFSFHAVVSNSSPDQQQKENGYETPINPPPWIQISKSDSDPNSNPIVSEFDPEIISTFRKALEVISPTNTSLLRSPEPEKIASPLNNRWMSILSSKTEAEDTKKGSNGGECPPGGEDKVVIYFTSLRGVRKTYEDCCDVRVIIKGLGVRVDERDVSMHYGFREELKELMGVIFCEEGDGFRGGGGLPRVFVKGRYIGGVDEIRQLHEDGGLEKLVHGCPKMDDGGVGGGCGGVCEACGDIRFVPCERCSGSCKIYYEGGGDGEEERGRGRGRGGG